MLISPKETKIGEDGEESGGSPPERQTAPRAGAQGQGPQGQREAVVFSTATLGRRCLAHDGVALLVIMSCSDRNVIDHLRGGSLIEKVSIDKEQ